MMLKNIREIDALLEMLGAKAVMLEFRQAEKAEAHLVWCTEAGSVGAISFSCSRVKRCGANFVLPAEQQEPGAGVRVRGSRTLAASKAAACPYPAAPKIENGGGSEGYSTACKSIGTTGLLALS
jgi:hypothetical protein